jgi:methionyl-tRNA formyltransferase
MKRILFMGTPDYATEILKKILDDASFKVVGLVTQPDKPVGRKQILTPPHTKRFLLENGLDIDIFQPKTLRDPQSIDYIRAKEPDFIVVAAFGQILPKAVLEIAPCINLHASILPKYRGASPIQAAILNRDTYSGVTAMLMDEGLDTGDMLGFSICNIVDMNAMELFEKLSHMAADLTLRTLHAYDTILPLPQLACESTYAPKIRKEDGLVDFEDAGRIYAKYLAFIYWPGVYLASGLKLKKLKLLEEKSKNEAGMIREVASDHIVVGCSRGSLAIYRVQPASKKEMSAIDYIRGKRLGVGDRIS